MTPELWAPGSPQALEQGCTCPPNQDPWKDGYMGFRGVYEVHKDCPYHGGTR